MNFNQYFQQLWFTDKESEIFLALYKLWTKPASTIAKYVNLERTYVYKVLINMANKGIILTSEKNWIKQFFIPDLSILKNYISAQKEKITNIENNYPAIESELLQYSNKISYIPKISLYDWFEWVKNLYNDIYETTQKKWYFIIKFFATNTFSSQQSTNNTIKDYYENFFQKLQKKKIFVDAYIWNWDLILEQIYKTDSLSSLEQLPTWNSSLNLFIVWDCVYILIFKEIPFWIKFDSEDFAGVMHFIFEHLKTEN